MNTNTNRTRTAQTGMEQPQVSMSHHDSNNSGSTPLDSFRVPPSGGRAPEERAPSLTPTGDGALPVSGLQVVEIDAETFNRAFAPPEPPPVRFMLSDDGGLTIDHGNDVFLLRPDETVRLKRFLEMCHVVAMVDLP